MDTVSTETSTLERAKSYQGKPSSVPIIKIRKRRPGLFSYPHTEQLVV